MNFDFKKFNCCRSPVDVADVTLNQPEKSIPIPSPNEILFVDPSNEYRYENIFKLIKNLRYLKRNENEVRKYFSDSTQNESRFQKLIDKSVFSVLGIDICTKQSKDLQTVDTSIGQILNVIDNLKGRVFFYIQNRLSIYRYKNENNKVKGADPPKDLQYDTAIPNIIKYLKDLKEIRNPKTEAHQDTKLTGPGVKYLRLDEFSELLRSWQLFWLQNSYFTRTRNILSPLTFFCHKWQELVKQTNTHHIYFESNKLAGLYEVLQEYFGEKFLDILLDESIQNEVFKIRVPDSKKILDINDLNVYLNDQLNVELLYGSVLFKNLVRKFALGKGTFGKVFLAQSIKTNNYYAIKMLKKTSNSYTTYQDFYNNCIKERNIQILASSMSCIVKLLAAIQTHYEILFVMEYVSDVSLETIMSEQRDLSESELDFYANELMYAVCVLHSIDIVHRDLKPNNILIDKNGHCKVADFGWAKYMKPGEKTYTSCQTEYFRAPEVTSRLGYDNTVDNWSIGAILFFMAIKSSVLLTAENVPDVLNWFQIPDSLRRRLFKLLNVDPNKRIIQVADFDPLTFSKLSQFSLENPNPPRFSEPEEFENKEYTENLMLSQLYTKPLLNWGPYCEPGDNSLLTSKYFTWFHNDFEEF